MCTCGVQTLTACVKYMHNGIIGYMYTYVCTYIHMYVHRQLYDIQYIHEYITCMYVHTPSVHEYEHLYATFQTHSIECFTSYSYLVNMLSCLLYLSTPWLIQGLVTKYMVVRAIGHSRYMVVRTMGHSRYMVVRTIGHCRYMVVRTIGHSR